MLSLATPALLGGCQTTRPPIETVDYVDLERFMGDWYVIASIPTFIEKGAHNAVESYRLAEDGTIELLVDDSNLVLPRLFEAATQANVRITSVDIQEPNLEAVFLHLTGRALRD